MTESPTGVLTGDATIVVTVDSRRMVLTGFGNAMISKDGHIHFQIAPDEPDATWTFKGQRAANGTLSGSHAMLLGPTGGATLTNGSWTATRR